LSSDGGRNFQKVALPPKTNAAAIIAVTAIPARAWMATGGSGKTITIYALDTATTQWSTGTQLTPSWPANLGGAGAVPARLVWMAPGGPNQVVVLTQLELSHSVSIPRLFVSDDSGTTFAQRVQPDFSDLNAPWSSVALSGTTAVAVIGNRSNQVIHSADAGSTWTSATVHGLPAGSDFVVGTPLLAGSTIYLPVADVGAGAFILLRSTDGGAVFDSYGAQEFPPGTFVGGGPPPIAASGNYW
jgi:hypothetical protein